MLPLEQTKLEYANNVMRTALDALREEAKMGKSSRENSLAQTNLEQAMMWNNKDRANKGELTKSETHV